MSEKESVLRSGKDGKDPRGTLRGADLRAAQRDEAKNTTSDAGQSPVGNSTMEVVINAKTGSVSNLPDSTIKSILASIKEGTYDSLVHDALSRMEQGALDPTQGAKLQSGTADFFALIMIRDNLTSNMVAEGKPFNIDQIPPAVTNVCDVAQKRAVLMAPAQVDVPGMTKDLGTLNDASAMQDAISPYFNANAVRINNLQVSLGNRTGAALDCVSSSLAYHADLKKDLKVSLTWKYGPAQQGAATRANNEAIKEKATAAAKAETPPPSTSAAPPSTTISLTQTPAGQTTGSAGTTEAGGAAAGNGTGSAASAHGKAKTPPKGKKG